MPAIFDRVLTLNLIANTAIFFVAARLYLLPLVPRVRPQQILVPILLLHSTRHLGLMFLTRGATFPGMPPQFAYPAAFGDLITAILAFAAIPFVLRGSVLAKPAVWVFNIVGTLDLLDAITLAHDLQCTGDNGTGLLDSRFLGSTITGYALCDLCSAWSPLAALSRCNCF
jgi:hypothetical protein